MEVSCKNSNYSQPLSAVTVLQLPNELLLQIFEYLNGCDVIYFALTCKRFSSLCQSVKHLDLENSNSSLGKSLPLVTSFFRSHVNPALLRSCNLNGCYWISTSTLKSLLVRCSNLEELHILETKLALKEMVADILPKCTKVTKLSFTLNQGEWLSFAAHLGTRKQPTLCRLKSVEMIVSDSCPSFEILHFLQSCEKLEEIVVHKACAINLMEMNPNYKLCRNPSTLKSVVFIATPVELYANRVYRFFDVRESSDNLTTFWCHLFELNNNSDNSNSNLINLTSVAWAIPGNRNQLLLPLHVLHPGLQLENLESYQEPQPILMRSVLNSPTKLKLISCFYDSNNFQNFCESHPLLEVLKLGISTTVGEYRAPASVWNGDSWRNLSRLRILSLEAALIEQDKQKLPYLASIVQSCPLLQELEIMGSKSHRPCITEGELSSIAQLGPHLKRLTLTYLNVKNGIFLEHILKSCNQLESLRLKCIGPSGEAPCCYASNLITALPSARKLTTFCLFQKNVPQMELLLDSLESCTSISRLSLVCPSFESLWKMSIKGEFPSRLIRLCDKLSQLVVLFCYLNLPFENCEEANKLLNRKFRTERPAFRVDVQSTFHQGPHFSYEGELRCSYYSSREFPVMYNDLLASCQSQVALFPYSCNTFLQRTCAR